MGNYFTYDNVINRYVDVHILVCGTLKVKHGWSPEVIKSQNIGHFNSLHHITVKSGKYKIYRWIDNNVVYHDVSTTTVTERNRPRINNTNRHNIQLVWGDKHSV